MRIYYETARKGGTG